MKYPHRSLELVSLGGACLAAILALEACSASPNDNGAGGSTSATTGGAMAGGPSAGSPSGGLQSFGGISSVGGSGSSGSASGGSGSGSASGGSGNPSGGAMTGQGGAGAGGRAGGGGTFGGGGTGSAGGGSAGSGSAGSGSAGSGSAGSGSGGSVSGTDPCTVTEMPSGGTEHATNNMSGMAAGLAWTIWSNTNAGSITTYSTPAFGAKWNNAGDFLARIGLQWNATKTYDQYGTITADFNSKKSGSGGQYSYIGVYGWSNDPCVEWYIIEDSWNKMPVNPGNTTNKGTADIDGGKYTLYTRNTTGTGGSKCQGTSQWIQFYSVRQTARSCGQISITQHFDAWKAAGMQLGKMDQAQLLVEVGGGQGSIDFPVANVTAQ
jgi:endo-1,4-beta-xylanase